jgi:hypothetical protein
VVGVGWIWRSVEVTGSGKWALGLCFPEVMDAASVAKCKKNECLGLGIRQGWEGTCGSAGSSSKDQVPWRIQRNASKDKRVPPNYMLSALLSKYRQQTETIQTPDGREQWRTGDPV